jgi:hypothetical protein
MLTADGLSTTCAPRRVSERSATGSAMSMQICTLHLSPSISTMLDPLTPYSNRSVSAPNSLTLS